MATSKGVKKENARFVLPNACHTEIVVTMNFRAARNFLELRLDKAAQWEIRRLANYILSVLKEHAPNVFYDMEVEE
jgi:thymidylate synthase (FAD)